MKLSSQIDSTRAAANRNLYLAYEELIQLPEDLGYKTVFEPGTREEHHQITRPIIASVNHLQQNGHMKNIIYSDGSPTTVELTNKSINYRYNDFFQISYVLCGKIVYHIRDAQVTVEEGGVLLIDDNTYYCEDITLSEGTIINISVSVPVINEIFLTYENEDTLQGFLHRSFIKEKGKQNMLYFFPKKPEESLIISNLISDILFEIKDKKRGFEYICKGYLVRLMDNIASEYEYSYTREEKDFFRKYLFDEVKNYIFQNYQNIQIQDLIDHFHYQRNYFNRLIKDFTGMTYSDYLIEVRILHAKHLLETTRSNIDEIMMEVGYNNKGFFYNSFKERVGLSPAGFRKSLKQEDQA
ncbi:helix-turn-helix domain-containing protein [Diplocloster agilis]|uniref:helix-turn-helix domain-containing protein n=1 Tax=Diplocloster agilis TaxID=2850323 RepID=UPI000822EFCB|nr:MULTISPECIES: AraC family transcriptional regulator [Lachnospiraceae]MBU9745630.1 AraC family transcriptional regulator [Diplocloster agilis]MCU6732684.1 AraC family transcriptional regulator [Suonthocola fibrivorans]SCI57057.1 Melibiose operon regulatory protein [uncultured Clostridium sp.]